MCATLFAKDSATEQKKFNPAPGEGWVPSSPVIVSSSWNSNSDTGGGGGGVTSSSINPQVKVAPNFWRAL